MEPVKDSNISTSVIIFGSLYLLLQVKLKLSFLFFLLISFIYLSQYCITSSITSDITSSVTCGITSDITSSVTSGITSSVIRSWIVDFKYYYDKNCNVIMYYVVNLWSVKLVLVIMNTTC